MTSIRGNDVSVFQGDINYDLLKETSQFVIIKASEGTGFIDSKFKRNQEEARRVGMALGYYHFARPDLGNTPNQEASWFLSVCGELQEGEVLILDYEPHWDGDAVSWCKDWLDYVYAHTNCKPMIYLNQSQIKSLNWLPIVEEDYALWVASYTFNPNNNTAFTGPWLYVAIQQWTDKEIKDGISGQVDGDIFFGDLETFKKYGFQNNHKAPSDLSSSVSLTSDELKALVVLKSHFPQSVDQRNQPFGNLEGYANTLTQDAYNAWKHPVVTPAPPVVTTIISEPHFNSLLANTLYNWAKALS